MRFVFTLLSVALSFTAFSQAVGIGTTSPAASSLLDINSTSKGLLPPRMSSQQRAAISAPAKGLLVYDITTNSLWQYNGTAWIDMGLGGQPAWLLGGNGGTNATNFIGTTDGQPLRFRVAGSGYGKFSLAAENNISLGQNSQDNVNGGVNNVSFGNGTLQLLITGNGNTAVGHQALRNTTGTDNVALGNQSLNSATAANRNVAIGSYALKGTTTGISNTAVGYNAAFLNNTGLANVAIGVHALYANQNGSYLVAIGDSALYSNNGSADINNPSGLYNTAVGSKALMLNNTGGGNTGLGYNALRQNSSGSYNTALGFGALQNNTASYNTGVGQGALNGNGTGAANTALGFQSAYLLSSGSYNTFIGAYSGNNGGSSNTTLGAYSAVANGVSNATAIGANAYASTSNSLVLGDNSTKVGIGVDAPLTKLDVNGEILTRNRVTLGPYDGSTPVSNTTWSMDNYNGNYRIFRQSTILTSGLTLFTIKGSNSNVGINLENPFTKLDVAGNIRAESGVYTMRTGKFNLAPIGIVRIQGTLGADGIVQANSVVITNVAGNIATGTGRTLANGILQFDYVSSEFSNYSSWFTMGTSSLESGGVRASNFFDNLPNGSAYFSVKFTNSTITALKIDGVIVFYGVSLGIQD